MEVTFLERFPPTHNLSDMNSDILLGTLSDMYIYIHKSSKYPYLHSDILFDTNSDVLSDTNSDILSDILCGILSDI